ncbi:fungal-specific transcription factor domain-containing protein [Dactylonectria macrodidyma]|uniref:Fungal-specific transcription factor domain-containing protein n=1 Tax=Dactylonectria macrodidyma TaxID=307937 RepID=A0A9P9IXP3_9HYPO|nr:fungal-specific transcription factor domain-containing protein [Dactylonectria macrodidyma]
MDGHTKTQSPSDDHLLSPSRPSHSRPRDATTSTRRATRACDGCRRLKEKCIGGTPCDRCRKSRGECKFSDAFKRTRVRPASNEQASAKQPAQRIEPVTFFEVERIHILEHIVQYFTGIEDCSKTNLHEVMATLQSEGPAPQKSPQNQPAKDDEQDTANEIIVMESVPTTTVSGESPVGEFSHLEFSRRIQQKVESYHDRSPMAASESYSIAEGPVPMEHLLSRDSVVYDAVSVFPHAETTLTLVDLFFEFAQTNYFYVNEDALRQQLSHFYTSPTRLEIGDAPWVCTALMILAVGTQFAHLTSSSSRFLERQRAGLEARLVSLAIDDTLASLFYRKACNLMPDVLAIASLESVQAFLLFGVYTLPFDPAGLACNMFGIAIKVATQNGMHQRHQGNLSVAEIEFRKRIWWTAYILERRICILNGRPVSIARLDINAYFPTDVPELAPLGRTNRFQNNVAVMMFTDMMEEARDKILALRNSEKSQHTRLSQLLLSVKDKLGRYWNSLPEDLYCRDMTPGKPLFRSNIHLALTYHLARIFIGRSFIFNETGLRSGDSGTASWAAARDELIEDCVQSAITTIDLCQLLYDEGGLSKSSYTEFTSCYAAVLAIVGKRIFTTSPKLEDASRRGLELLKHMSVGIFSKSSEKRGLELLEMAVQKLDEKGRENTTAAPSGNGYAEFRNWVALQQLVPTEMPMLPRQDHNLPLISGGTGDNSRAPTVASRSANNISSFNVSTLGELGSLPGLDEWFVGGFP